MITQLRNGTWRIEGPGFDRTFDTQADAERMHEAFCPSKKPAVQVKLKHTPGPWEVSRCGTKTSILSAEPLNALVAIIPIGARTEADAARIVQCVNAHDALVEALTHGIDRASDVVERWESGDLAGAVAALTSWCDVEARAALAAAKVAP